MHIGNSYSWIHLIAMNPSKILSFSSFLIPFVLNLHLSLLPKVKSQTTWDDVPLAFQLSTEVENGGKGRQGCGGEVGEKQKEVKKGSLIICPLFSFLSAPPPPFLLINFNFPSYLVKPHFEKSNNYHRRFSIKR